MSLLLHWVYLAFLWWAGSCIVVALLWVVTFAVLGMPQEVDSVLSDEMTAPGSEPMELSA